MSRKTNIFTTVPVQNVPRNLFDLSHEVKMSGKFGYLYPCLLVDCVPGDTFRDTTTAFIRFAPMLAPVMHRIDVKMDYFFVPNRIIQEDWESFITGGREGDLTPSWAYVCPPDIGAASPGGNADLPALIGVGTLWDYLGLPPIPDTVPTEPTTEFFSVLPFRAYQKVWSDYFRDPNVEDDVDLDTDLNGNVSASFVSKALYQIKPRGWERDYFTSALPWAQRGPEVLMPLSATASGSNIEYKDTSSAIDFLGNPLGANIPLQGSAFGDLQTTGGLNMRIENLNGVTIENASTTINDFRTSLALQRWLENNARGGGRYVEQILTHFNVRVPDFRLQRAEYLGGGRQPVQISEVLSTADTTDAPVGDLAGHGVSVGKSNRFTYRCQEHGWIIGIMSVVPRTSYSQGVPKMWQRDDRYKFAFPEFANLGEQEILSKELFLSYDHADDDANNEVFGYIPRYAEYKYLPDRIAGDFRTTLDFWHLGRIFTSRPALDFQFTQMYEDNTAREETYRRIFAVQDGTDYLWMQLYHNLTAKRPLPYFGVPQLKG